MMLPQLFFVSFFLLATGLAFLLTPLVRKLMFRYRVVDLPSERKRHEHAIPTMGGLAIFVAFFGTLQIASVSRSIWTHEPLFPNFNVSHLFLGATPLTLTGMIDDRFHIHYRWKLVAQAIAAIAMIHFGYAIYGITNPFNGETVPLGFWSRGVTVLWFLFIINAINFMDGIDGLAAGVSLIASLTIFFVSTYLGKFEVATASVVLAGSIAGFLRYNFYPASIFMGDTGSLFLGFTIAFLSLQGAQKSSTVVALAIPIVILGLPILDVVLAIVRRWSSEWISSNSFVSRFFSWKKIFYPDLQHVHHRLLDIGLTKPQAVILLYLVAIGFGAAGLIMTAARYQHIALALLYMAVVFFLAFYKFPALQRWFAAKGGRSRQEGTTARGPSYPSNQKEAVSVESNDSF